jgi:hypothetical protein
LKTDTATPFKTGWYRNPGSHQQADPANENRKKLVFSVANRLVLSVLGPNESDEADILKQRMLSSVLQSVT